MLAYRSTAEVFSKRKSTNKLPEFVEFGDWGDVVLQEVRDRDAEKKQEAKEYADARNHAKERHFAVGDLVLLKRRKKKKKRTNCLRRIK